MIHRYHHYTGSFIDYECIPSGCYVHSVYVCPELRRKGIATRMVQDFLERFSQQNIYIFSSGEFELDHKILEEWYASFGFTKAAKSKRKKEIHYNYTHELIRDRGRKKTELIKVQKLSEG